MNTLHQLVLEFEALATKAEAIQAETEAFLTNLGATSKKDSYETSAENHRTTTQI